MSHVVTACDEFDSKEPRPQFPLAADTLEPITLMFSVDGIEFDPVVMWLGIGQASFGCTKYFEMFYEGQMIGPAVLTLPDQGMAVVYPVVKSRNLGVIHVEFMELSEEDRQMIARSLATCSGGERPPANRRTKTAASL